MYRDLRRWVGWLVAGLVVIATVAACGGDDDTNEAADSGGSDAGGAAELEDTLVVAQSGGELGQKLAEAMSTWSEETGVELQFVEGINSDLLARVQAERNNPQIDISRGTIETYLAGLAQGLWAPIDPEIVTNYEDFAAGQVEGDSGAVVANQSPAIFYNSEKFEEEGIEPPTSVQDLLAEPKLAGHVAFPDIANGYMTAYVAARTEELGGTTADPTPALEELVEPGRDFVYAYPAQPAEMAQLVTSGQVWAGIDGLNRITDSQDQGIPLEWVALPKIPAQPVTYAVVEGAAHPNAAQSLLNWMISEEGQTALALASFTPSVLDVEIPADVQHKFFTSEQMATITPWDYQLKVDNAEKWDEAWTEIVLG